MEAVIDLVFFGSKITADGDCSHEIKRHLLLERKTVTNIESIFKKKRHHMTDNVCTAKAMLFLVLMYRC